MNHGTSLSMVHFSRGPGLGKIVKGPQVPSRVGGTVLRVRVDLRNRLMDRGHRADTRFAAYGSRVLASFSSGQAILGLPRLFLSHTQLT